MDIVDFPIQFARFCGREIAIYGQVVVPVPQRCIYVSSRADRHVRDGAAAMLQIFCVLHFN